MFPIRDDALFSNVCILLYYSKIEMKMLCSTYFENVLFDGIMERYMGMRLVVYPRIFVLFNLFVITTIRQ